MENFDYLEVNSAFIYFRFYILELVCVNCSDLFLTEIVPRLFSHHITLRIPIPTHHYFHSIFLTTDAYKSAAGT